MSVILKPDPLNTLHNQVAAQAYDFYHALALCAEVPPDALEQPIENCQKYIATIQHAAHTAQLSGLTQLCEHLLEKIASLRDLDAESRFELCSEIEHLPLSISNYLYAPIDSVVCRQLANCVQDAASPGLLEMLLNDAKHLQKSAAPAQSQESVQSTEQIEEPEQEQAVVESKAVEPELAATLPVIEPVMQLSEIDEEIDPEFSEELPVVEPVTQLSEVDEEIEPELSEALPVVEPVMQLSEIDEEIEPEFSEALPVVEPVMQLSEVDEEIEPELSEALPVVEPIAQLSELDEEIEPEFSEALPVVEPVTQLSEIDKKIEPEFSEALPIVEPIAQLSETDEEIEPELSEALPVVEPIAQLSEVDEEIEPELSEALPIVEPIAQLSEVDEEIEPELSEALPVVEPVTQLSEIDEEIEPELSEALPVVEPVMQLSEVDEAIESEFSEALPVVEPVMQLSEVDEEIESELSEALPVVEPIAQLSEVDEEIEPEFSEVLPVVEPIAQLSEVDEEIELEFSETLPVIEPVTQLSEIDEEIEPELLEALPVVKPVMQLSEIEPELSGTLPAVEPIAQLSEVDEAIESEFSEALPAVEPIAQLSEVDEAIESELSEALPVVESVTQLSELDEEIEPELSETLPVVEPIAQLSELDEEIEPELSETLPVVEPIAQLSELDEEIEPELSETLPVVEPIAQLSEVDEEIESELSEALPVVEPVMQLSEVDEEIEPEFSEALPLVEPVTDEFETVEEFKPEISTLPLIDLEDEIPETVEEVSVIEPVVRLTETGETTAEWIEPKSIETSEPAVVLSEDNAQSIIHLETEELDKLLDEEIFDSIPDSSAPDTVVFSDELTELDDDFELEDALLKNLDEETEEEFAALEEISVAETLAVDMAEAATVKSAEPPKISPSPESFSHPKYARRDKSLDDLSNKIVEVTDTLTHSLHLLVTAENDSEAFLIAVEEYTNIIQMLWERAEKARLGGLQRVCTFINDNVFELSALPQDERFKYFELFSAMPQLMLNYVQDSRVGAPILVEYLGKSEWFLPFPADQLSSLAVQLRQEAIILQIEQPDHIKRVEASSEQLKLQEAHTVQAVAVVESAPIETVVEEVESAATEVPKEILEHDEFIFSDEMPEDEESFLTRERLNLESAAATTLQPVEEKEELPAPVLHEEIIEPVLVSPIIETPETSPEVDEDVTVVPLTELSELKDVADAQLEIHAESLPEPFELLEIPELAEHSVHVLEALEAVAAVDTSEFNEAFAEIEASAPISNIEENSAVHLLAEVPEIVDDAPLINADNLDNLQNELAEAMDDLHQALHKFATVDNDSSDLLEAVEQYTDNIQSIADTANGVGLQGLAEVCAFVNENMYELSTQPRAVRRSAQPHLEEWNYLIQEYVSHPRTITPKLIEHLSDMTWPFPLDSERAAALSEHLLHLDVPDTVAEKAEKVAQLAPEIVPAPATPTIEEVSEIILAPPAILHRLQRQLALAHHALSTALVKVSKAEDESEDLLMAVGEYTEAVQTIWDAAEGAGLKGLQDFCSIINDNVMAMSAEAQPTRLAVQQLFADWIQHAELYLQHPTVGTRYLTDLLQNPAWLLPPSHEQLAELHQSLLTPSRKTESSHSHAVIEPLLDEIVPPSLVAPFSEPEPREPELVEPEIVLASADILMVLEGQLLDSGEQLAEILTRLLNAEDGSEELLMIVGEYNEAVQVVWDTAEMAHLAGLQEVCTFVNDNVMLLGTQDKTVRLAAQDVFNQWIPLASNYLQQPRAGAEQLLQHLQNPLWAAPISATQAAELRHLLLQQPDTEVGTPPTPEPVVEPAREVVEDFSLAAPEVLELLQGQVQDTAQQLNEILQRLVDADDGHEDLLMAVGEYTEAVQAIWDAAEMAHLAGLQEVCGFINDNVMAFGMLDKTSRSATQVVFVQWLEAVSLYLRAPRAGAHNLFNLLQNTQWANPLDIDQAKTLEQKLTQSGKISLPVSEEQHIVLAAPEILEVVRNQITDLIEGLSSALEVCISMQNDNPALLEAVENYTNQVQAIYDAAEMAGLAGLQDVCVFINDNLMALSAQEQQQKLAAQSLFQQFPHQVLSYLSIPHSGAPQLVKFLQHPDWATPLVQDTAPELLQKLLQSSTSDTQVAAYEQQVEVEQLAAEIEEETEAESEDLDVEVDSSQQISLGSAEVLEILTTELAGIKDELTAHLEKYTTLNNNQPGFSEAAENYADNIGRLAMATEMVGLTGLQQLCQLLIENVQLLAQKDLAARVKAKKLLEAWPDLILAYLNAPMEHVIALLNHFRESQWAKPLPDEQAHELLGKLTASAEQPEEDDAEAYQRQTVAKPEDVVLNVPPDINRELLEAYLIETPQHAQEFSQCVQNIIRAPDAGEIQKAKRIAHTLKGSSRIIGIEGIANMGHHLEDILEYFTSHQDVAPPKELTDMMVEAADCIETMVDSLLGQADAPENSLYVLQSVLDWANKIDKGNLQGGTPAPRPATSSAPAAAPKAADTGGGAAKAEEKAPAGAPMTAGDATPEQVLRVPTKTVDNLLRLVGELSISIGQIQERLKHVMGSTRLLGDHSMVLQKKTFELENLVDVRGITGVDYSASATHGGEFDSLEFEEYNELHSVAHSFIESIADTRELGASIRNDLAELETMFIQHERLNRELQANIMTTRMVPVNTIISKLQRNIRQTCRMTGKQAELVVRGADIMMDSDVLNNLGDPLMHLLRNSIDHGLESPDERVMLGKPAEGTVLLSFYREGNNIVVSCKDDGQGLNYTNIRYKAIEKGLLRENQEVSDAELARMILMSGFSTKSGVTQVSGRGVGMDVVHTNIRNMKGTLDIVSETGKGSNFVIKLPMTLVTVHVLIVRIGQLRYGIPTNTIEQALVHGAGEFQIIGNELTMKMGKRTFAVKALSDLLSVPADKPGIQDYHQRPVVLVREETGTVAVIVDELVDTHDLVMKSMGKFVQKVRGVVGASILGDGHLIPLLDLPELLRSPMQALMMSSTTSGDAAAVLGGGPKVPNILVVDDSLSVRKSMSLLLEEQGFEVLLAKDGLEAIEVLNQTKPDIMLVDMEMPRMNGLELTAHARANTVTAKVPIFMITSRTTEKHREQAKAAGVSHYLTKPYQDTELLALIDKGLAGGFN